jgi:dCTP deaminase
MLAITRERVHLKIDSRVAARVEGRSSLARLGLMLHITAPTVHAGWNGHITLEMVNLGPFHLKLVPEKTRICQLIIERLESDPGMDIAADFQGQTKPSGGR